MTKSIDESRKTLIEAMIYFRHSVEKARATGAPQLAILSNYSDGGGKIIARFDCEEFFEDLAQVLGCGEFTERGRATANAVEFIQVNRLTIKDPTNP